ncbi:hypothetical protein TNIN_239931 [Trichonephila inaurata madagascariensis]|uniref:Uncharacterized protein n=1 Tax=Trichonephila inaurata madagascariensis TaxID=2747483 RepID=A0A8X6JFL7_9ARAC|nr:hypothetical protein TNIN_239931 [Trichonephila inaurata madagascariensis]
MDGCKSKNFTTRSFCNCRQKDSYRPPRSQGRILLMTLKKSSMADGLEFVAQMLGCCDMLNLVPEDASRSAIIKGFWETHPGT